MKIKKLASRACTRVVEAAGWKEDAVRYDLSDERAVAIRLVSYGINVLLVGAALIALWVDTENTGLRRRILITSMTFCFLAWSAAFALHFFFPGPRGYRGGWDRGDDPPKGPAPLPPADDGMRAWKRFYRNALEREGEDTRREREESVPSQVVLKKAFDISI